ncbi:DUF4956 domain-containing protein [Egicoccus halophilus]|uniref:DUF4956 domain-containing protein n=1 Tax=Egicoccus halophilus TaxID=1670830 RepID=A0A8J3ETN3_9ACTN|nr:DUF4956 domain-containing protein [Egicoccus halophilus]GGI05923.1 DUF4956 domain-containing protein [Egicoccus halophilus]
MGELALPSLVRDLVLNLVAVTILAYAIYFRRHRRRDLLLGYVALNVSLFTVAAALGSSSPLNVGVGFGLFAVLSIVRLRSDEATQSEIGYTMVALVLGLVCGLPGLQVEAKLLFSLLLVATMYVADHPALIPPQRHQRCRVVLDVVHTDHEVLRRELERRLGGIVHSVVVQEVDYVRETMRLDVRVRLHRPSRLDAPADADAGPREELAPGRGR